MSDLYWLTDEQMARLEPYFLGQMGVFTRMMEGLSAAWRPDSALARVAGRLTGRRSSFESYLSAVSRHAANAARALTGDRSR